MVTNAERTGRPRLSDARAAALRRWGPRLVLAGLTLAALNLRPAITSVGPLLGEIRQALGMNGTTAGLLTSVPPLCFGVVGLAAPRLARRFGPVAVMAAALTALTAGLVVRTVAGGTAAFLASTGAALAGIAVANVLMPVLVKRFFPDRIGTVTGLYSMSFSLGSAAAAALTVPFADLMGGSWRAGLALWAATAALAPLPWLAATALGRAPADGPAGQPEPASEAQPAKLRFTRSPVAWSLAVFFGLQATSAYVIMGWLPQIYRDAGVSAATAGVLLAISMGIGVPLSFVLPRAAARARHQGPMVAALGAAAVIGYAGLWAAPAAGAWAWAVLLGFANCAFPLALTMIGLRARTSQGVTGLSAFTQSTGYLLCVPGPLVVGTLNETTGGWRVPLAMMIVLMLGQIAAGVCAGRDRSVEDDAAPEPAAGRASGR